MISVTTDMIFRAVIFSLVLGVSSGVVYSLILALCVVMGGIVDHGKKRKKSYGRSAFVFKNLFDFFFTLTVGIAYLLILYVCTDGTFNIISLMSLLFGFLLTRSCARAIARCCGAHKE